METEINIEEILKDCPKGMKLYSPAFGELTFISIDAIGDRPILTEDKKGNRWYFYPNGIYSENSDEITLFPSKDQRDWSKFKKPIDPPFEVRRCKKYDTYFLIDECLDVICTEDDSEFDWCRYKRGNYFNIRKQAEYAAEKVKELLLSLRKEVSK